MSGAAERIAREAAARAVAAATGRLIEAARAAAPDVRIERTDEGVRVEGRGVVAALRWVAGLLR